MASEDDNCELQDLEQQFKFIMRVIGTQKEHLIS